MTLVAVVYDSRSGLVETLAGAIVRGVEAAGARAERAPIYEVGPDVLRGCDGLIVGSPNWSGMTGALKEWFDYSGDLWQTGELAGKPGAAFTAGYSRSGGIEATLLQLLHLLLGHGMVVAGLPWSERMRRSGSYYGVTAHGAITEDDLLQASELGRRLARLAQVLA